MFPVDPRDFVSQNKSGDAETCVASNVVSTDPPTSGSLFSWSLGDPFFKSNLVVFYYGNLTHPSVDPPKIGFLSTVPQNASSLLQGAVEDAQQSGGVFESTQLLVYVFKILTNASRHLGTAMVAPTQVTVVTLAVSTTAPGAAATSPSSPSQVALGSSNLQPSTSSISPPTPTGDQKTSSAVSHIILSRSLKWYAGLAVLTLLFGIS